MAAEIEGLRPGRHEVTIDGLKLSYEVKGTGPVCLMHSGGPGVSSSSLRVPALERYVTTVYLDPVGTGQSSRLPGGDYSVALYADLAYKLLSGPLGGQGYFLGHSHGGFVGLQLALDHPDVLLGMICYDSAPCWGPDQRDAATLRMREFVQRFPDDPEAQAAEATWLSRSAGSADVQSDASVRSRLQSLWPAYFADFRDGPVDFEQSREQIAVHVDPNRQPHEWDIRPRLSEIVAPVLLITGRYDWICVPQFSMEMWQKIRSSTLVALGESGHFAHLEQPEEFANAVNAFVTRTQADATDLQ
jgi:pimeloyl-ACP methyl ester carboxylesterase